MAKQRYKRIQAGRLVREILWTPVFPCDSPVAREAKSKISTAARKKTNLRRAWEKLELLLAANFADDHLHVVLTYRDDCLPANATEGRRLVKKALGELRTRMRARGEELLYVYNIEGRHTNGRLHHHLVLNLKRADLRMIQECWPYGMVRDGAEVREWGYKELAQYLTKEAREEGAPVGARSWIPAKGLKKPESPPAEWVPDNMILMPPVNAHVLERETRENEFGRYWYMEYLLPDVPARTAARPRTPKKRIAAP